MTHYGTVDAGDGNYMMINGVRHPVINSGVEFEELGRKVWRIVTEGEEQSAPAAQTEATALYMAFASPVDGGYRVCMYDMPTEWGKEPSWAHTLLCAEWDPQEADRMVKEMGSFVVDEKWSGPWIHAIPEAGIWGRIFRGPVNPRPNLVRVEDARAIYDEIARMDRDKSPLTGTWEATQPAPTLVDQPPFHSPGGASLGGEAAPGARTPGAAPEA
jgi:hypothetical protein